MPKNYVGMAGVATSDLMKLWMALSREHPVLPAESVQHMRDELIAIRTLADRIEEKLSTQSRRVAEEVAA